MFPKRCSCCKDAGFSFSVATPASTRDSTARDIPQQREIAFDGVQQMGKGPRSDVEKRLDGYRADNGIDVDMTFLRGFKSGLERIKMGDNVVSLGASTEKIEDGLCSIMVRPSYSIAMSIGGL